MKTLEHLNLYFRAYLESYSCMNVYMYVCVNNLCPGEVQYTLGLFEFFLLGNDVKAETFILSAVNAYEMQLGRT
jgi:hypothetical protein